MPIRTHVETISAKSPSPPVKLAHVPARDDMSELPPHPRLVEARRQAELEKGRRNRSSELDINEHVFGRPIPAQSHSTISSLRGRRNDNDVISHGWAPSPEDRVQMRHELYRRDPSGEVTANPCGEISMEPSEAPESVSAIRSPEAERRGYTRPESLSDSVMYEMDREMLSVLRARSDAQPTTVLGTRSGRFSSSTPNWREVARASHDIEAVAPPVLRERVVADVPVLTEQLRAEAVAAMRRHLDSVFQSPRSR